MLNNQTGCTGVVVVVVVIVVVVVESIFCTADYFQSDPVLVFCSLSIHCRTECVSCCMLICWSCLNGFGRGCLITGAQQITWPVAASPRWKRSWSLFFFPMRHLNFKPGFKVIWCWLHKCEPVKNSLRQWKIHYNRRHNAAMSASKCFTVIVIHCLFFPARKLLVNLSVNFESERKCWRW